ncbi:MAG: hypothetical protein ABF633_03135 [Clostridium sp.]|uniref:hypothetical protein n=1 Tax=Clostridium sp. TaxID=1506 RepID=UPI0039EB098B
MSVAIGNGVVRDIIQWLINTLGYYNTIVLKDVILFVAGVSIGGIIMILLVSRFFYRIKKVESLGRVTSVRFRHGGQDFHFIQTNNFWQSIEFLFMAVFLPSHNQYTLEDIKRTRNLVIFIFVILGVLTFLGILFIFHPLLNYRSTNIN